MSREIDALVAKHIFDMLADFDEAMKSLDSRDKTYDGWGEWRGSDFTPLPFYSTDIAAAWRVVGEVRRLIFSDRLSFKEHLLEQVSRRLMPDSDQLLSHSEVVLHLEPMDICLAALKAKGVMVE